MYELTPAEEAFNYDQAIALAEADADVGYDVIEDLIGWAS